MSMLFFNMLKFCTKKYAAFITVHTKYKRNHKDNHINKIIIFQHKKTVKWTLSPISLFFAVSCFLLFLLVCLYYVVSRNLIFVVGNCDQMAFDQYRTYCVVNDCYQDHGYYCIDKGSCCAHFC